MPSNLPSLSPVEVVRMLKRAGFEEARQKGSHLILVNTESGKRVTIPVHKGKDIKNRCYAKLLNLKLRCQSSNF